MRVCLPAVSNPPLPPPLQPPPPAPLHALRLPGPPSAATIQAAHPHSQLELAATTTHTPASAHHTAVQGPYANPHGQQYTLATRARMQQADQLQRSRRRHRSRSRSPAGLVGSALNHPGHAASGRSGALKTSNTDLTRYANSSSFRGTTPPQRLRYIFRPRDDDPTADFIPRSDGRYRSWEEVAYDAPERPRAYTDERGREWLPVLSKNASADEWAQWEARERRRIAGLEARLRERALRDGYSERESERRWSEIQARANIHPWFLSGRNRDGSSFLLTPDGQRPMALLDRTLPWAERQYHHVGRDPMANYQTIFGGLEAERERQAACNEEERLAEKARQKALRKEARDYERARRKEEKMRLRYDLEVQKLAAEKAREVAAQGQMKVVKKIVHNADGTSSVVFVKRRVGGTAAASGARSHHAERHRSPSPSKPLHAPWGSSVAAQRNASRLSTSHSASFASGGQMLSPNARHALSVLTPAERRALGMDTSRTRAGRPQSAQRGGWLNPDTRDASMQPNGSAQRRSSRSRSHSRSRSRSTSSSRRRAARRAEKAARAAAREERERKLRNAKHNSTETQAGSGELPEAAAHPRASELEAHLLREAQQRKQMSIQRLSSTLNSLDKLSLGGVGSPQPQAVRGGRRAARSRSSSSDSSSLSGSSDSSGFSSRDSSVASRGRSRSRSRSSSRSRRRSRRHGNKHSRRSRSRSASRSRSHSRSRSLSSSSSSSSSRSTSRSGRRRKSKSSKSKHRRSGNSSKTGPADGGRRGEWVRRGSFEEMDERVRGHSEAKWLRAWEKRYAQARTSGQKRALKLERSEWKARRQAQHTLLQAAQSQNATDQYLQSPTGGASAPSSTNAAGVLTDQYGTAISSYGTVYPQASGTLLQQASILEQYSAQAAHTEKLLAESQAAVEATVGGIENIVDGLRVGYATKGMDMGAQQADQRALQLSLRAAIRAREDRRKKSDAMARANRHVLDELRRQEAVIMARGQDVSDSIQLQAYEQAAHAQLLRQQQLDEQRALQQAALEQQRRRAARAANGGRGRGPNWQLGNVDGVDQFWYEHKDASFTPNHVTYNSTLRSQLGQLSAQSP